LYDARQRARWRISEFDENTSQAVGFEAAGSIIDTSFYSLAFICLPSSRNFREGIMASNLYNCR
jgi:hypothetical protein